MTKATTYNIRIKGRILPMTAGRRPYVKSNYHKYIHFKSSTLCTLFFFQNSNGKPQAVPTNTSYSEAIIHIWLFIKVQFASNLDYIEVRNQPMNPWNDEMPQALGKES